MFFFRKHCFLTSIILHSIILMILVLGFDFTTPLSVFENTNKNDVISAVVLGDIKESKILPQKMEAPKILNTPKPLPKSIPQKKVEMAKVEKNVIALAPKKKEKPVLTKKQQDLFAKDLLADIKKQHDEQKKMKQKELKKQFENVLKAQSEKSLRQHLFNEDIKLTSSQSRQSQGEVNKYKALILQVISQNWLVPPGVNKKSTCELLVRLAPGGVVLDVQISKSSGDVGLDRSARAAVLKSSPLPVPKEPDAFDSFRQFVLKVKPENVLASDDN